MTESAMDFPETISASATDHPDPASKYAPMCFACARCKYPICTSESILFDPVDGGTTAHAFRYDLDCLLDLEEAEEEEKEGGESEKGTYLGKDEETSGETPPRRGGVPCYTADETVLTSLSISAKILDIPLAPAARLLALDSIVESHAHAQEQENAVMARLHPPGEGEKGGDGAGGRRPSASGGPATPVGRDEAPLMRSDIHPLRCYGATSELRVDFACLDAHVLGLGVALSTKDRSAWVSPGGGESRPRKRTPSSRACEEENSGLPEEPQQALEPGDRRESNAGHSPPQLPQAILDAIAVPPPPTRWEGTGNFTLDEAFVTVRRRTTSAAWATWFKRFRYIHRVECPDCHMPLGFLFQRWGTPEMDAAAAEATQRTSDNDDDEEEGEEHRAGLRTGAELSSTKEPLSTATHCKNENEENVSDGKKSGFPDRFIGLELKRIIQQPWGLRDFQARYAKSQNLETFRGLFPEAEELQSLYGRLTALRTQSELYNNLLRKHKEQNDVQGALLQSQKSRMSTYEDKLLTMQHIITTQRMQLDMQTKQVKQQDDLLSSHRSQLNTLRQQMLVENMLLSEQSKTIESQREQIRVMKTHLGIQMIQDRLNARRRQLEKQLRARDDGDTREGGEEAEAEEEGGGGANAEAPAQSPTAPERPGGGHGTGAQRRRYTPATPAGAEAGLGSPPPRQDPPASAKAEPERDPGGEGGFRAIQVAPRRGSRLPPVHLRGVVASGASTRGVGANSAQEEQTASRTQCTGGSSRS